MKWAVIGPRGMLGSDLLAFLEARGEEVHGFHRDNFDLTSLEALKAAHLAGFDVVVNCVAYTKVDLAEDEPELAYEANAFIPERLALSLQGSATKFIHISTDYVFDGTASAPYGTTAPKGPLGVYGKSKAVGEDLVLAANPNSQIVRTSWLYGANGRCFPKTIAAKLLEGAELRVVNDQFGSPTHTLDLSEFIYRTVIAKDQRNVLHGVSAGSCSWFEFASAIRESVGGLGNVSPVSTSEYPTRAPRPHYSVLEPSMIENWQMPNWHEAWIQAKARVLGSK